MDVADTGDFVFCDPPYPGSQSILYGAQDFTLDRLIAATESCKARGATVALTLDGTKKSGRETVRHALPDGLFERALPLHGGRSMLKRFQMDGRTLEGEDVSDILLVTR